MPGGIILSIDGRAVSTVAGCDRALSGLPGGEATARSHSVIHRHSLAAPVGQGKTYRRTPGRKNPGRSGFFCEEGLETAGGVLISAQETIIDLKGGAECLAD
jgi:hypothetical protein